MTTFVHRIVAVSTSAFKIAPWCWPGRTGGETGFGHQAQPLHGGSGVSALRLAGTALALALALPAAGCAPPRPGCGVLVCVSSPYLRARGAGIVGMPINQAMIRMGGQPNDTIPNGHGGYFASWVRKQDDRDMGMMFCMEAIEINNGIVVDYMTRGNCG